MDNGYYLYAIAKEHSKAIDFLGCPGIDPQYPIMSLTHAELIAIVSQVPLSQFGKEALAANVQDFTWLEPQARAHDGIVRQLASKSTIIPIRFATVYYSADNVRQLLVSEKDQFKQLLDKLDGRWEMGVTIDFDKEKLRSSIKQSDSQVSELADKIERTKPGTAYLLQKKLETQISSLMDTYIDSKVQLIADRLSQLCISVSQGALASPGNEINLAYVTIACLVDQNKIDLFQDEILDWGKTYPPEAGMTIRLTGPWPPYTFSSLNETNRETVSHVN